MNHENGEAVFCIKLRGARGKKPKRGNVTAFFVKYCTYNDLFIKLTNS